MDTGRALTATDGSYNFVSADQRFREDVTLAVGAVSTVSAINYMIDGIETRNNCWAHVSFRPSIDMISEFKIEWSAYGGKIGLDGSVVVKITTKSGANGFMARPSNSFATTL